MHLTSLQVLAVDIMYCHPHVSEVSLRTAVLLCLTAAYPPQLGVRAVELLSRRASAGAGGVLSIQGGTVCLYFCDLLLFHKLEGSYLGCLPNSCSTPGCPMRHSVVRGGLYQSGPPSRSEGLCR